MRQLIVEMLRKDGYDVVEADTGAAALALLALELGDRATDRVDLLISDVRMPGCTGTRILERIRTAQRLTPVILMTAFGDPVAREQTERLDGVLLHKPFDLHDLRVAVVQLLGNRGSAPSVEPPR